MSNENGSMTGKGGSYSFASRLHAVRGKLMDISSKISQLESNVIFLLVNPFLVDSPSAYTSSEENEDEGENENDSEDIFYDQPVIIDSAVEEEWQHKFITDSSVVNAKLAECMTARHGLLIEQKELVEGFNEEKKKHGHEPDEVIILNGSK